jgi:pyruvate dehydrogenase E2 component (dihydrolipoamide acetyltransferase)
VAFDFRLHDIGEGIDGAEVVEWHVAVGDEVKEDQPLVDVETDKAIVTLPCPVDGVVSRLCVEVGDVIPVGDVLAVFGDAAETAKEDASEAAENGSGEESQDAAASPGERAVAAARAAGRPLASPAVRKLARERGVDLSSLAGSGPGGRIVREDVDGGDGDVDVDRGDGAAPSHAPAEEDRPAAAARADEVVPLRGVRRAIARNMTEAWRTIPHIVDFREVDATGLIVARRTLREQAEGAGDGELARAMTMLPLLAKIAATVALRHPQVNSSVDMEREEITRRGAVNLSIAISTPDGLLTPVVRDADRKSTPALAREIVSLAEAARSRRLTPEQLAGGTLTVNNYGSLGSSFSTPIIPPGQSINLGIGRVDERAVVRDGEIVVRPILALSCSGDHRVLDGADLGAFVNDVVATIENPVLLLGQLA